ncbi:redox-regulated ATPase YchF [Candidatus Woesearchaeota archaeon]|nr:redox-regulated ATPase YchF [Candidatus Woesearchaeota archaeon]
MQIGVVGKPSTGKSTLFKAATLADVAIAAYPFTTIKPNSGIGFVKIDCIDVEFHVQCNPKEGFCSKGQRFLPVQLIDVAGLVPGAHEGKGMGNQFLSDLNQADALIHVVDMAGATNEKGEAVQPGSYDPARDVQFLEIELDMWYLSILKKGWEKLSRKVTSGKGNVAVAVAEQMSGLRVTEAMVKEIIREYPETMDKWDETLLIQLARALRQKSKPMIVAANKMDLSTAEANLKRMQTTFPSVLFIPCAGDAELALREALKKGLIEYVPGEDHFVMKEGLSAQQKTALEHINKTVLQKFGSTGVQDALNKVVFDLLHYVAIYPGGANKLEDREGHILYDCFLMPPGSTAIDFAFRLHTDIGRNFVKAIDVKTKRVVGKDHILKHRDVIEIAIKK